LAQAVVIIIIIWWKYQSNNRPIDEYINKWNGVWTAQPKLYFSKLSFDICSDWRLQERRKRVDVIHIFLSV
jgi:hypothetical protein